MKIDPRYAEAFANRGIVRKAKEDIQGAILDWEEVLRVAPANRPGQGVVEGWIEEAKDKE